MLSGKGVPQLFALPVRGTNPPRRGVGRFVPHGRRSCTKISGTPVMKSPVATLSHTVYTCGDTQAPGVRRLRLERDRGTPRHRPPTYGTPQGKEGSLWFDRSLVVGLSPHSVLAPLCRSWQRVAASRQRQRRAPLRQQPRRRPPRSRRRRIPPRPPAPLPSWLPRARPWPPNRLAPRPSGG